jgi:Fe-S cluster assembly protein SufD
VSTTVTPAERAPSAHPPAPPSATFDSPLFALATAAASRVDNAPEWLVARRTAAAQRFAELGVPNTRNEDWHYTNPQPIAAASLTLPTPDTASQSRVSSADLSPYTFGHPEWPTLAFINGRFAPQLSNVESLPAGVRVLDLETAWKEEGALLDAHLGAVAVAPEAAAFTALNTACLADGAVIIIAKEMVVETPIHLLWITDANGLGALSSPRTLVLVERHAKATVIESFLGVGAREYVTNAVGEVVLEDGATLHHTKVQREPDSALHVGTIQARQARDSHYLSFSFHTGAHLGRTNIYTTLAGEGAGATLNGLYMLDGSQHGDHQTRIEHAEPNCFSRETYKGILDGHSHGVFNGKVYVHPIAQKTDGKQTNNTLLLSKDAQIDTKPQLEIFADDVKCTHGATVGQIDRQALFYFTSRGIDEETARRLLVYAFAADVLETIEAPAVRDALEELAMARYTD